MEASISDIVPFVIFQVLRGRYSRMGRKLGIVFCFECLCLEFAKLLVVLEEEDGSR